MAGEKSHTIQLAAVVLLCGIAVMFIIGYWWMGGGERRAYYYDLNTGELFIDAEGLRPPIAAPSGPLGGSESEPAGVRAYVFTCDTCSEDDRYVAWLEKWQGGAVAESQPASTGQSHPFAQAQQGGAASTLVALPRPGGVGLEWVPASSRAGIGIIRQASNPCPDDSAPKPCVP